MIRAFPRCESASWGRSGVWRARDRRWISARCSSGWSWRCWRCQAGRPVGRQQMIDAVWGEAPAQERREPRPAACFRAPRGRSSPDRPGRTPSGPADLDRGRLSADPAARRPGSWTSSERRTGPGPRRAGRRSATGRPQGRCMRPWGSGADPVCDGLSSPFLDAQADRLAESRVSALEDRIELDLAIGRSRRPDRGAAEIWPPSTRCGSGCAACSCWRCTGLAARHDALTAYPGRAPPAAR